MKRKVVLDFLTSLLGANFLANYFAYRLGDFEVQTTPYLLLFLLFLSVFFSLLLLLRRKKNLPQSTKSKFLDALFPIYLLAMIGAILVLGVYLGDIYDKDFGARVLAAINNDFLRNIIDIYASGANETLLLKPIGLVLVLFCSWISRVLAAILH